MDACVCLSQKQLVINIFLALCIKLHLFLWQIFLYRETYRTLTRKTATEHGENGISRPWKSIKERNSISAKAVIYVSKKELYMIINRCSKWHFHGKLIEIYGVQRKKCSSCHVFMWHVACNIGWVTWQIETIFIKMDYQRKLAVFLKKKCLRYLLSNVQVRVNSFNPQIKFVFHTFKVRRKFFLYFRKSSIRAFNYLFTDFVYINLRTLVTWVLRAAAKFDKSKHVTSHSEILFQSEALLSFKQLLSVEKKSVKFMNFFR